MAGKIIILEGIDRAGKSTFAKWLADNKGFRQFHFGKPDGNAFVEYADFLFNTVEPNAEKDDFVIDRYMYGEFVYAPIYGRKTHMDYHKLRFLESYFAKYDTRLVIAENPLDENWRLIQEENEGIITSVEAAIGIREYFRSLAKDSMLKNAVFDYTKTTALDFFNELYPVLQTEK